MRSTDLNELTVAYQDKPTVVLAAADPTAAPSGAEREFRS
jgi:hypothetical protein